MSNPENALSSLEPFQDPGFLYPLLKRANEVAAILSQYRYDNSPEWVAEAKIDIIHGGRRAQVEFRFTVRVSRFLGFRWFTLNEAEMIIERLQQESHGSNDGG